MTHAVTINVMIVDKATTKILWGGNIVLNCTFNININSFLYCLLLICTYFCKKINEYYNKQKKYVYYKNYYGKLKKKKKKKNLDGLSPQWGGGSRAESTFHVYGGVGGGVSDKLD